ncbi:(2Fe-2S)-binding protein [Candidatus Formimonas warabiya]|uniref:(2Fe-2S)-binding protein n=1 Tax=Formimonas warabiya TaxID=1761012 RepID=A0A3G1KZB7_FORW1|nr:(2Fe-2S)-binding protein [Candidatus Formimonas warabiya]ATW27886.1 (2Fe-2S)-binding protein [Candidatus Formimonas warabiya]
MSEKGKTYLCRCEDITLEEIQQALKDGAESFEDLKRITRCTMGPCQGKTCRNLIMQEIAKAKGIKPGEVDVPTYRAIAKPVKLGKLAGAGGENNA